MSVISLFIALAFMAQASGAQTDSFDDLGKLLLGGLLSAIGVAIVIVLLKLKTQDKGGASNDFISISPTRDKDAN